VDVRFFGGLPQIAPSSFHLRCRVISRSHRLLMQSYKLVSIDMANSEIGNDWGAVRSHQNICRLNISMNDSALMSGCKGITNRFKDGEASRDLALEGRSPNFFKRTGFAILHHVEVGRAFNAVIDDADNIGVRETHNRRNFALKSVSAPVVLQRLQC